MIEAPVEAEAVRLFALRLENLEIMPIAEKFIFSRRRFRYGRHSFLPQSPRWNKGKAWFLDVRNSNYKLRRRVLLGGISLQTIENLPHVSYLVLFLTLI
jgi:hypothetical protein